MIADHSGWQSVIVVECNREIGFGESNEEPILEHCGRTRAGFLGGLADQHQSAVPLLAMLGHPLRCSSPSGHVKVVPAGVHHTRYFAGEGEASLLGDRQGIEFSAQHDDRSVAVLEQSNYSGASDSGCYFVAEFLDARRQFRGGLLFFEGQFRMTVNLNVELFHAGIKTVDFRGLGPQRCGATTQSGNKNHAIRIYC